MTTSAGIIDAAGKPKAGRSSIGANLGDRVIRLICAFAALLVMAIVFGLVAILVWKAWLSITTNGASFFSEKDWNPEEGSRLFGSLAFVYGTLVSSALAMLIAVPLGVGTAAYLSEIAPNWLRKPGSYLVEMLAAVPSVVYGFWGMFILGPTLQKFVSALGGPNFGGAGILPASIILAIMIVPYITAVSLDVCRAVPTSQREAALALGATRWQTIWSVVLPFARPGIIAACFLALGRAVGETMAVTMLIGNSPVIPKNLSQFSIFDKADTIASAIANQFAEATYDLYLSSLVELALVLFLVTVILNSLARLLLWRVGRGGKESRLGALFGSWWQGRRMPLSRSTANDSTDAGEISFAQTKTGFSRGVNRLMTGVLGLCLTVTLIPLFLILAYLLFQGAGAINWDFFVNLPAAVGEPGGGMANALVGSAKLVGMATLLAVPVGLLAAIYLAEYRDRWFGPSVRFLGELLGGVPSIVIGIFAYTLIIQTSRTWFGQPSLYGWAGVFALAVMMLPIVMRASEEALKLVPQPLRHASLALGANNWQTLLRVTVPAALPAIITAVFLAIARIVGETAPLLLTAGSNRYWPTGLSDYTPSLPVFIFNYAVSPSEDWHRQAWAAALVLIVLVMLLNFGIRALTGQRVVAAGRGE